MLYVGLIGQRHFELMIRSKSFGDNVVIHGSPLSGRHDLIRGISMPIAANRWICTFVCEWRA